MFGEMAHKEYFLTAPPFLENGIHISGYDDDDGDDDDDGSDGDDDADEGPTSPGRRGQAKYNGW